MKSLYLVYSLEAGSFKTYKPVLAPSGEKAVEWVREAHLPPTAENDLDFYQGHVAWGYYDPRRFLRRRADSFREAMDSTLPLNRASS